MKPVFNTPRRICGTVGPPLHLLTQKDVAVFPPEMATDNDCCRHGDRAVSFALFFFPLFALCCHRPISSGSSTSSLLSPVMVTLDPLFRIYRGGGGHVQTLLALSKVFPRRPTDVRGKPPSKWWLLSRQMWDLPMLTLPLKWPPADWALHGFMMKSSVTIHPHMCSSNIETGPT